MQFQGLPLEALSVKNAIKLGEMVEEVFEVEDPWVDGVVVRSCLRVRVHIDVMKPLASSRDLGAEAKPV